MLTVHCLIKNEENFIEYALRSVVRQASSILIFDTGSTDATVSIIKKIQTEFPQITLEEKGECDKVRHTTLRQEMIERTKTDWFMILDGDEIWTTRGLEEAVQKIKQHPELECVIAPFYLCVGDVYHFSPRGQYMIRGKKIHATPRFFRVQPGMRWVGMYNQDSVCDAAGKPIFEKPAVESMTHKFWHVSHLTRSSKDDQDYSSGSNRAVKRRLTYFIIGRAITEPVPEVLVDFPGKASERLSIGRSIGNFGILFLKKIDLF